MRKIRREIKSLPSRRFGTLQKEREAERNIVNNKTLFKIFDFLKGFYYRHV
jgi:hypothetical protein